MLPPEASSRLDFGDLRHGFGFEVEHFLVRAQSLAGFVEETAEIFCVVGLFVLDEIVEFLEQRVGVEIHAFHGALGAGIDAVELDLCFIEGAAGAFLAVEFLFSLAEVLAEDALEEAEFGRGFFIRVLRHFIEIILKRAELLQRSLILLLEEADAAGDDDEFLRLDLRDLLPALGLLLQHVDVLKRLLVAGEDVFKLLVGVGDLLALVLAQFVELLIVLFIESLDGPLLLLVLSGEGALEFFLLGLQSQRVGGFQLVDLKHETTRVRVIVPDPVAQGREDECEGEVACVHMRGVVNSAGASISPAELARCSAIMAQRKPRDAGRLRQRPVRVAHFFMKPYSHLVAAVDFTPSCRNALRQAVRLAAINQAQLTVVHVMDEFLVHELKRALSVDQATVRSDWQDRLKKFVDDADVGAPNVHVVVRIGHPFTELSEACQTAGADLLVMGVKGSRQDPKRVGVIAAKCVRKAPVDVLLVREDATGPFKRVATCVDFSDNSGKAVRRALQIAGNDGAAVDCLYVYQSALAMSLDYGGMGAPMPFTADSVTLDQWRADLISFVKPLSAEAPGVQVTTTVIERINIRETILEHVQETHADLVVLGTRGRTGLREMLIGTTAEKIVGNATCSILAVKPDGVQTGNE